MTASPAPRTETAGTGAWAVVVAAGVASAMHVWKLPGALSFIQEDLGMDLVASGVLLGIVQVGSMLLGLVVSLFSEILGLRRMLVVGLALMALGSLTGSLATAAWFLMLTRAVEGVGFLMAVVVAPPLIRRVARPAQVNAALGWWSAYQGMGIFLAVLVSTLLLTQISWNAWWMVMAAVTAAWIPLILLKVPVDPPRQDVKLGGAVRRIGRTVSALLPWIAGIIFACYTIQWGAVLSFLPTVLGEMGQSHVAAGVATAIAGGVNAVGNLVGARLLQRGAMPRTLVITGLITLGVMTVVMFAPDWTGTPWGPAMVVGAAAIFSCVGGFVPSSLTRLAVDIAPADGSPAAVIGLMTQLFNGANFIGPIILAGIATATGGWHFSWVLAVIGSTVGVALAAVFLRPARLGLDLQHRD